MSAPGVQNQTGGGDARARSALGEMLFIAWPTVLTMTSYTVMQFADKLMVGQVGPTELAAQSNGGVFTFAVLAFAMGFLTVINTFVSQNLGAGRPERGPQYAWAGFWCGLVMWLVVLIPYGLVLPAIFGHLQGHTPELVALESGYAQILLAGSFLLLISRALNHFFFGLHRPRVVTVAALAGNVANIVCNYALIYGEQGLPRVGLPGIPGVPAMGVYGAALGTLIGTAVELIIPALVFLGPKLHAQLGTRNAWRPHWQPIKDLLRIGWPAAIQLGNEIICWAIFLAVFVGAFGEDHMAASGVAFSYLHLSFMPAVGLSVAVTSLVGKYVGAGQPDVGVRRARLGVGLAVGYMTLCAAAFLVFRRPLVEMFISGSDVAPERIENVIAIGARLMIIAALFQTIDAFGIVYTGALRGAGDTVWPGVVTVLYSWLFIVAGGWAFMRFWPSLESVGPWIGVTVYIIMYGLTMGVRFERGRWRSIKLLHDERESAAQVAPLPVFPPGTKPDDAVLDFAESAADRR